MTPVAFLRPVLILALVISAGCASLRNERSVPVAEGVRIATTECIDVQPDADRDGLADPCELQLAAAFAPLLMMHGTRCTPPPLGARGRIPGGYFHAAQPVRGAVRLVYMPAYYRDCGWRGPKCMIVDCTGHAGDSEIIVVDVKQREDGAWVTDAVFLSAHCFGRSQMSCRWYRDADLAEFDWVDAVRGAPVVWVSDARNANYPSRRTCDEGHLTIDRCAADSEPYRFPIAAMRNIGSRAVPMVRENVPPGCVSGLSVEPLDRLAVAHDAVECFWDDRARFRGWQGSGDGATPYAVYLGKLGF